MEILNSKRDFINSKHHPINCFLPEIFLTLLRQEKNFMIKTNHHIHKIHM